MISRHGALSGIQNRGACRVAGKNLTNVPCLADDEIHIWTVKIDGQGNGTARSAEMLAPAERVRASGFRSEIDAARFIQRRTALREILGGYLGVAAQDVAFAVNEFGKPSVLAPKPRPDLSFNAAHSGALALVAVGRSVQIGIDVERLRSEVEGVDIAARFFAVNEVASLAALRPRDRGEGFFNAWTRKEAIVKALGRGLSIPLDAFEVSLRPREPPVILRWNIPGDDAKRWRIHHLEPASGYVGALAVDSVTRVCRFWSWAADRPRK